MEDSEKFPPRNYQVELMEIAISRNTIIYLPTGSGKTFIAIMVLKRLSASLLKSYSEGGKISLILVNSVTLAAQHKKYVLDHTIFRVGAFTGEMNLDFWTMKEWIEQFDKFQVIIMTSQILVNLINTNFIDMEKVNLLIFDECHSGVEEQPMRQVMKAFQNISNPPRILGLTATLLNGNCKLNRIEDEVRALETTYHSQVATVDGLETVIGYSTNPQEKKRYCSVSNPSSTDKTVIFNLKEVTDTIDKIKLPKPSNGVNSLPDNLKPLENNDVFKRLKNLIVDLTIHIEMLGTFGGYKACVAHMIQIERLKKHCQDYLLSVILNYVMTMLSYSKAILKNAMESYTDYEKVYKFSSDKVLKLFEILKEYRSQSDEELCCLIFVKRRFTAKVVHHILQSLKTIDPGFHYLKTNFIVGNKNNPYNDTRENLFISKKNKEVLDSFVNKEINVLVSSNVLEEGVDIPKCTLVIKFDKSEDYRSYIQSKGRARHKKSLYYTIVENVDTIKFDKKYADYQRVEDQLNQLLIGQNLERSSPSKDEIDSMYNEDGLPPYYVNGPNSAQVNMASAVSLLCRYCSGLARDQYTVCAPQWCIEDCTKKCRVVILLPVACPILEPIVGPFMKNKKNAKRAAALCACIALHEYGELDDNLLPVKRELKEEDVSFLFEHWPEQKENSAGHKKKKRLHRKEIPDCINDKIEANKVLYLHLIQLNPSYKRSEDFNQAIIFDLYKASLCFGLLSPKPLPELCQFPIFDSSGEIQINIKVNVKTVNLSKEEVMELRNFHFLIFNDLLEILKPFLIIDNTGSNSDMLLMVPVRNEDNVSVDFAVAREHKTLKSKQLEPSSSERLSLRADEESYLHKIVSPWYRPQPSMYVVTRVCLEKNAFSAFPNQDYSTFSSYFEDKHSLKILNFDQPLLLVKGLSKRLNAFKPRGRETKRNKEKRYEELEEYLIPELVVKQEFPSCLWVQARFLPTILSRVIYLLKLQNLQSQIARDIGVQQKYLNNCPPLELDLHLLNYVPNNLQLVEQSETAAMMPNECLPLEPPPLLSQQYNKDLATKMLEDEYSWPNIDEPKDIERELSVTVMDIEYYETFINTRESKEKRLLKNESPVKHLPAITYNKEFEQKHLNILSVEFDNQCPALNELYSALTAAEANDIVNLERLETLGDSFLKFISSLYIISKFPKYNEGQSTALKGKLVSNRNLYYLGVKKNLGGILKNSDLSATDEWSPPCFCIPQTISSGIANEEYSINSLFNCNISPEEQISGTLNKRTLADSSFEEIGEDEENSYGSMCNFFNKQYVGDKTVADSVEALLGAYFQSGGVIAGIKFVKWIGILPQFEDVHSVIDNAELDPVLDKNATQNDIDRHIPQWKEFEQRLGYHFKNRGFLLQALTHASYSSNRITQSYERLEFIGDAILDFLITCYIYEHCGYLTPGQVTDLRSALVNNNTFASLVVRCGFHKFLLMINLKLQSHVDKFAEYFALKNYVIDDEVLILLEEEDLHLAEHVDVPKVLGDVFEAIAGAVYLDSNKNLKTVWEVIYKIMWKEMDLFSKNVPTNVIRRLYECHTSCPPIFSRAIEAESRTMVALEFMCEGRKKRVHGFGANKVAAKRAAAKIALHMLKM